jgi:hypothetical protein
MTKDEIMLRGKVEGRQSCPIPPVLCFFFLLLWRRGGEFIPISKEEESSLHAAAAMIPLVRRCRLIFP